jgi:hypothetical protein
MLHKNLFLYLPQTTNEVGYKQAIYGVVLEVFFEWIGKTKRSGVSIGPKLDHEKIPVPWYVGLASKKRISFVSATKMG